MKKIPDEIKRGMELLDEKAPGWQRLVSPDLLDMSSHRLCVLGQLFGDFGDGLKRLSISLYGTAIYDLGFETVQGKSYIQLTQDWKEALQVKDQ